MKTYGRMEVYFQHYCTQNWMYSVSHSDCFTQEYPLYSRLYGDESRPGSSGEEKNLIIVGSRILTV
jgi:hypothetical protein